MVKVFREEPVFIKVRKAASEFPQWIHLKVPQGRYKVNAPLEHRMICKEAMLIAEIAPTELYSSTPDASDPDVIEGVVSRGLGAPHNHLFLEATTASSVSSSHNMILGSAEDEELLKNSTKFAKLTMKNFATGPYTYRVAKDDTVLYSLSTIWACDRMDSAYSFPLGSSDETSLHVRVADCEGHGLFLLSNGSAPLLPKNTMVELTISLVYQVFVQDVEMPQHPKEGLLGYYRNAITEPLSNI